MTCDGLVKCWVAREGVTKVPRVEATDEHERKLDAPDGFELPDLGGSPLQPRVFTSVYYDVPERSLSDAGPTLRRRTQRGLSVLPPELPLSHFRLRLQDT